MQGQSSLVHVKDPYTSSIRMHVGSTCNHTRVYKVHLRRIIKKLVGGSTRKQNRVDHFYLSSDTKSINF